MRHPQIDDLKIYATKQGWTIIAVKEKEVSGSKYNEHQAGIAQLLEAVSLGKLKTC